MGWSQISQKFFDQIIKEVVTSLAGIAGMPQGVLEAYKKIVDQLTAYNNLVG